MQLRPGFWNVIDKLSNSIDNIFSFIDLFISKENIGSSKDIL